MAHVLIVEDDQSDRLILGNIVEQREHEVSFASGGREALKTYVRGGIDVVVTDLQMPDGSGLDLIESVRLLRPRSVIIAVSGKGPELLAEAERKGAFAVFSKPVDPDELLEAIGSAAPVDGSSTRRRGGWWSWLRGLGRSTNFDLCASAQLGLAR